MSPEHESVDRSVVAEVLRPVIEGFLTAGPAASTPEGLRDRKKRLLRQLISDTATALFLERGFDEVTVSEIAEACDVSEKTVFNYFPTKEALLLDREEYMAAMLAEALRDRGDGVSLTEAVVAAIEADVNLDYDRWAQTEDPSRALAMVRRFAALIQETPALQAALQAMNERLTQVAARTLADRAGIDPEDPEPQLAAATVLALWSAQFRALQRYADGSKSMEAVRAAVLEDVHRAARVADSGLSAFNLVVQPSSRQQLRQAADAANEARKQVVVAVKQARDAWRQVVQEAKAHHHAEPEHPRPASRGRGRPTSRRL